MTSTPSKKSGFPAGEQSMLGDDPTLSGDLSEPGFDPLAGSGERKRFGGGSLVIVAVIVTALAGLWFMRSLGNVSGMTGGDSDVDAAISDFVRTLKGGKPGGSLADASALAVLSESYTNRQVPLESVAKNPFIVESSGTKVVPVTGTGRAGDRKAQIEQTAARLQLKSVIMGSAPLANIGGKIVRKGDDLVADDITYKITDITADSVSAVAEDLALGLNVPVTIKINRDR